MACAVAGLFFCMLLILKDGSSSCYGGRIMRKRRRGAPTAGSRRFGATQTSSRHVLGEPDVLHIDLARPASPPSWAEPLLLLPQDQEGASICLACVLSFDSPLTPSISENMFTFIS